MGRHDLLLIERREREKGTKNVEDDHNPVSESEGETKDWKRERKNGRKRKLNKS